MLEILLKILGIIFATIGAKIIYDARNITKRLFGFGDQNEASAGLKILGFILLIIAGIIILK